MEENYYVHNAGMVLLWPYLGMLFERAGLTSNGEFPDNEARQQAVLLLEFIVSEDENPGDDKLLFNKFLCGYPLDAPITVSLQMDENLEQLCSGLLEAVISSWTILGNTSITGLRETFLLREGILNFNEDNTDLRVTIKPYDILLDQLPWSLSPVKLSWIQQNLIVYWR
ncbi:MAG: hypothetical protein KDC85_16545 [Saprospiraceae bacterium]|nr:hypothetical protein [Saprospiraceae bacterium]MCB9323850.1 hypothetical protein [Lewinellaceae bacterium]